MKCRHCFSDISLLFADLGIAPPSNQYLTTKTIESAEKWYPLKVLVCQECWLVQTKDYADRKELFNEEYPYFSSFSSTWLTHCKNYVTQVCSNFNLNKQSLVGEIASNDGYLLQYFQEKGIPNFGVDPTNCTAEVAKKKGLNVFIDFFGRDFAIKLVQQNYQCDLLIANNVLAHVPDINDFITGFKILLKKNGVASFEFPHLLNLVSQSQFDTIYHEHFSYLSLTTVNKIFEKNGLSIFEVEEHPVHGGSLRVFAQHSDVKKHNVTPNVSRVLREEEAAGIMKPSFYSEFQNRILQIKHSFLNFLLNAKNKGEKVVGYGAAAKGNTLINFSGVHTDLIHYIVDKNPAKQNKYLPGSRIPVVSETKLQIYRPEWIVIFPWNLKQEIMNQLSYAREWGAKFVTFIPTLKVL